MAFGFAMLFSFWLYSGYSADWPGTFSRATANLIPNVSFLEMAV